METMIFKTLKIRGKEEEVLATSFSQIDTFLSCPYKWEMKYWEGYRVDEKAEALALGSAIHEALEEYFLQTLNGKEFTTAEAHCLLEEKMVENDIPFASEENKLLAEEQHKEMMRGLVEHDSELAKFMFGKEILACEKEFIYEIPLLTPFVYDEKEYKNIYIVGSIDFIVKDENGGIYAIDYKSGKKVFEPKKLKTNLQLPIYSLVILEQYNRLPVGLRYYFTRLDTFQDVMPIALNEYECTHEYYKNGKLKQAQRTVNDILCELLNIFDRQYSQREGGAKPTILCNWCEYGLYASNSCPYTDKKKLYFRKDMPIPKANIRKVKRHL